VSPHCLQPNRESCVTGRKSRSSVFLARAIACAVDGLTRGPEGLFVRAIAAERIAVRYRAGFDRAQQLGITRFLLSVADHHFQLSQVNFHQPVQGTGDRALSEYCSYLATGFCAACRNSSQLRRKHHPIAAGPFAWHFYCRRGGERGNISLAQRVEDLQANEVLSCFRHNIHNRSPRRLRHIIMSKGCDASLSFAFAHQLCPSPPRVRLLSSNGSTLPANSA